MSPGLDPQRLSLILLKLLSNQNIEMYPAFHALIGSFRLRRKLRSCLTELLSLPMQDHDRHEKHNRQYTIVLEWCKGVVDLEKVGLHEIQSIECCPCIVKILLQVIASPVWNPNYVHSCCIKRENERINPCQRLANDFMQRLSPMLKQMCNQPTSITFVLMMFSRNG